MVMNLFDLFFKNSFQFLKIEKVENLLDYDIL